MENDNDDLTNNIFIGINAGYKMEHGSYNIFLGHGAGEELIESNNLFILKSGDIEYRFQITKEESEKFRIFIDKVINDCRCNVTI